MLWYIVQKRILKLMIIDSAKWLLNTDCGWGIPDSDNKALLVPMISYDQVVLLFCQPLILHSLLPKLINHLWDPDETDVTSCGSTSVYNVTKEIDTARPLAW